MKKVSIIMPIYNVESYLERSIESLICQTLDEFEIILIDDGSSDTSKLIMDYYARQYPDKIKAKTIVNNGAAYARNIGLSMAEGEYIGFVDSDDYVDRTMFEKLYNLAKADDADITTCGYYRIDDKDIQKRDIESIPCFGKNVFQAPELFTNNVPYIWNKLFKKSLIDKYNIQFEEHLRIFEDLVFTYKLFLHANRISRVNQPLYTYIFSRNNSLTFSFTEKRFDLFPAFDSLIAYYKDKGFFYHFEEELLYLLMNHIYVVCGNVVQFSMISLKYRFINQGFMYLDANFPFWRKDDFYYRKSKRNKFLCTKKMYWFIYSLVPREVRMIKKRLNAYIHSLTYNRAGSYFYKAYIKSKINVKHILINSQHGTNLSGNLFYILKEICTNTVYEDFTIGVTYSNIEKLKQFQRMIREYNFRGNLVFLKNNSKEYTEFLATAKYLFNDTSFPVYFIKRDEQIYVNTWHGTPLKTLGRSTANDYYDIANLQKNFICADYLLYPSDYMKNCMINDYMIRDIAKNKVLKCGYPRNEIFFDIDREKELRKRYGLMDKQVIAYMPTWRGNVRSVQYEQCDKVLQYLNEIDQCLRDDQVMYVNLHPYVSKMMSYDIFTHIYEFPEELETYDFLNCSDILITDYSSVLFDYTLSKKKIILFAYDEEEYFKERGIYMDFQELPFVKVKSVNALITEINNNRNVHYEAFLQKYCPYDKKDIAKQICDAIFQQKTNDLIIEDTGAVKETMLVFTNDLRCESTRDSLSAFCKKKYYEKTVIYLSYETKELRDQLFFKELPDYVNYMGTMNHFSCNSLFDSLLLGIIESHQSFYRLFQRRIMNAMDREWKRSYHNICFDSCLIFGYSDVKNILFASKAEGKKYIYIEQASDFNNNVCRQVYERFDHILFKNENVYRQCNYHGLNASIKECESFEDIRSV